MANLSRVLFAFVLISAPFSLQAVEKIDVNTAPLEDLVKIIHVGEARALELISLRPFSSLDDLARIKGISNLRIEEIKEQGLAWAAEVSPQSSSEEKKIEYPSGVVFNEILPSPEGADAENEWIELFNENGFAVDLSGWQIKDFVGRSQTYTFPEGTEINSKGFLALIRPKTNITLNNDGDSLKLIQPDGKIINEISYEKAPRGNSFNLTSSGWGWNNVPTPNAKNSQPAQIVEGEDEPEQNEREEEKQLAAAGQSLRPDLKEGSSDYFVFLMAFVLASFSGIIILGLKKKLKVN